jgi:hypothetical protein
MISIQVLQTNGHIHWQSFPDIVATWKAHLVDGSGTGTEEGSLLNLGNIK